MFTEEELDRARQLRDKPANIREYRAAMIVLCQHESNMTREQLSNCFGINQKTVYFDMESIRRPTTKVTKIWGGGNNRLMNPEEETQFLEQFAHEMPLTSKTVKKLHEAYNRKVGRNTPYSTIYRLLKRHKVRVVKPSAKSKALNAEPKPQTEI
jgi:transposase